MVDRDGKKPFIIPKTHTSTKDVLISEKPDSRNVIELFNDIKSYALEAHFDFRQHACKSCDTIRNQKLQKLYNEKRLKMKKEQDPIERLAFHLITYRDVALTVANDGLRSEQLSFSCEKYLGNPKDGVHLSRRPDVLLTSSGAQGLYRFGLLVCKILLGKGYATIPSTSNNQLPAQLHYDHHFCKIQSNNKDQKQFDDLLANSLVFCYEHENFETVTHPPQILPIAILWYDLVDRFPPELILISNQESHLRMAKRTIKNKPITTPPNEKNDSTKAVTWQIAPTESLQDSNSKETNTTKYPSHFMVPFNRVYSTPNPILPTNPEQQQQQPVISGQQISSARDPRLARNKREPIPTSSETIPLSPQQLLIERSLSDSSIRTKTSSDDLTLITKTSSLIYIPLNSSVILADPRLKTLKSTRLLCYLEPQAVRHAIQQQKRLNHYCESKNSLLVKTSYTPIRLIKHEVTQEEFERLQMEQTLKFNKYSNGIDYSSLYISVIDCFHFGFLRSSTDNNSMCVDLEQIDNRLAYEQLQISNDLIQREKQLNSQHVRLRLREKRQRRTQQQISERQNQMTLPNSKIYITKGRQMLKEHQIRNSVNNEYLSTDLVDFFSREYKNENRPYVKHLLAELFGVFLEKYEIKQDKIDDEMEILLGDNLTDNQTINTVIDMDLASPMSGDARDYDERFPTNTPPLPPTTILPSFPQISSIESVPNLILTQTVSNESKTILDDENYTNGCQKLIEQLKEYNSKKSISNTDIPTEVSTVQNCLEQLESSSSSSSSLSSMNGATEDNNILIMNTDRQEIEEEEDDDKIESPLADDDPNRSLNEFVKLLTKEASISKSSSPAAKLDTNRHTVDSIRNRRRSHDNHDDTRKRTFSTHYSQTSSKDTRHSRSPSKKISSNRTVLISDYSSLTTDKHRADQQINAQEEPKHKRLKIDAILSSTVDDKFNGKQDHKSNLSAHNDEYERRRNGSTKSSPSRSRSRSHSKSKDLYRDRRRPPPPLSHESPKSNERSSKYSHHEQRRSSDQSLSRHHKSYSSSTATTSSSTSLNRYKTFNETSYRTSSSSPYQQRNSRGTTQSNNPHQQPISHKRFNYYHQSVADHPRFSHSNSTTTNIGDINYSPSSTPPPHRHHTVSPVSSTDRNTNSPYYSSKSSSTITYLSTPDPKPSKTFESLAMFLQNNK